jgi:CheY-like chemotaxis protein
VPAFRCPKCAAVGEAVPDAQGVVTCRSCGVKLKPKPGAPLPAFDPPRGPAPAPAPVKAPPAPSESGTASARGPATLETLLAEIRVVRQVQEQILGLLRGGPVASAALDPDVDDDDAPPQRSVPPVRSRRRKSVLLIDDDPATRTAAKAALEAADVPVRVVEGGNAALAAIAEEKPDVIAMELEVGGAMPGKDVINMIKATMEWVDIPIVLYTRAPITSQKEARTIHGADEIVLKASEGPSVLVSRVITLFRRA